MSLSISTIVTHDKSFHADDVLAVAVCKLLWPQATVLRTRDKIQPAPNVLVLDVGGVYDPDKNLFDHHQQSFDKCRPASTVPYSSAGLIWHHFGKDLLVKCFKIQPDFVDEVWQYLDTEFFFPVDCIDNGIVVAGPAQTQYSYLMSALNLDRHLAYDEKAQGDLFLQAVDITQRFLKGIVAEQQFSLESKAVVETCYNTRVHPFIVEMPMGVDGILHLATKPDVLFCIYPRKDNCWCAQAIPHNPKDYFSQRMPFPQEWAGLMDDQLDAKTGLTGGIFCHKSQFLLIAKTKQNLMDMVHKVLEAKV